MSFHAEGRRKAKCPLYLSMARSEQSGIYGICCCKIFPENDSKGSSWILRFANMEKVLNWKRIYCDSTLAYPLRKLYRAWQSFPEEVKECL